MCRRTHLRAEWLILLAFTCACSSARNGDAGYEEGEEYPGGETTNTLLFGQNALSRHVENITAENERLFFAGNGFFNQPWVTAPSSTEARDGLGPLFNARGCSECHFKDGRGRPPLEEDEELLSMLFRIRVDLDDDEMPIGDDVYGGQLQPLAISTVLREGTVIVTWHPIQGAYEDGSKYELLRPEYDTADLNYGPLDERAVLSPRVAPAMHGLGLLEAIEESRLEALADEDDEDQDGISGRLRRVPDEDGMLTIGRFGWKAEQPTVLAQSAGAFLGDIGLSTSLSLESSCTAVQEECLEQPSGVDDADAPFEVSDDILERVARYSQLLAVPMRSNARDAEILEGKNAFLESGCAECHVPRHVTGQVELVELSRQTIFPYTDLLLHDMGEELADGRGKKRIDREWRTPPLWGLRFYPVVNGHDRLLHDGRARGVEEAILWHGGEAETSRDTFRSFDKEKRRLLIRFVESL